MTTLPPHDGVPDPKGVLTDSMATTGYALFALLQRGPLEQVKPLVAVATPTPTTVHARFDSLPSELDDYEAHAVEPEQVHEDDYQPSAFRQGAATGMIVAPLPTTPTPAPAPDAEEQPVEPAPVSPVPAETYQRNFTSRATLEMLDEISFLDD